MRNPELFIWLYTRRLHVKSDDKTECEVRLKKLTTC